MWKPFDMELVNDYEEKPDELAVILNHIKILCGNDEVVTDYFIKWIAQMIQYPEVKSICPTLISKEGSGKGTLLLLIEKMIGFNKYFETTNPMRDIWGDFNGRMANTFLINLNEMSKKDTLECQGRIKGLITDGKLTINNKGMNQYQIQSYHRFIVTTNNEDPIVTKSDDRRNLVIRTSDELKGNDEYFKKMNEMINDVNVIKTFYEYLKNIPNMENFREIPLPQTEHQNEMKEMNMDIEERWVRDMVSTRETDFEMSGTDNFKSFMDFCIENGIEYKTNALKLGLKIKRLIGDCIDKGRDKNGMKMIFLVEKIRKKLNIGCLIK
jgi:phage/plasmid-associated DNA primase